MPAPRGDRARPLVPLSAVLPGPLQNLRIAAPPRASARRRVPLASVGARPLKNLQVASLRRLHARVHGPRTNLGARAHFSTSRWPPHAANAHVIASHGHPLSRAHCSTSRWPPFAASAHVIASHEQPFSRAHFSTSRWPCCASNAHVRPFHGQSFARARFNTSRWPPFAASAHVSSPHGQSCSRAPPQHLEVAALRRVRARLLIPRESLREAQRHQRLEISIPRNGSAQETVVRQSTSSAQTRSVLPVSALEGIVLTDLLHLPPGRVHRGAQCLLTARSTARSAGSGRCFSTRKTATSKGKAGKATPACAQTPRAASATISRCAACTARVVVRAAPEIQDAKTRRQPYPFIVLAAWHIFWFLFFSSVRRGLMTRRAPPHVTRTTRADARAGGARVGRFW